MFCGNVLPDSYASINLTWTNEWMNEIKFKIKFSNIASEYLSMKCAYTLHVQLDKKAAGERSNEEETHNHMWIGNANVSNTVSIDRSTNVRSEWMIKCLKYFNAAWKCCWWCCSDAFTRLWLIWTIPIARFSLLLQYYSEAKVKLERKMSKKGNHKFNACSEWDAERKILARKKR